MGPVFTLTLRQLASRNRLALILFLAAIPVGLATLISAVAGESEPDHGGFINGLLDGMLISGVMPIVIMVLATAAFGNELEDRTLGYLVLKPMPRWQIAMPKLLAVIVVGVPAVVASGVGVVLLGGSLFGATLVELDSTVQATLSIGVALLAGGIAYAALFTWAGLITTRALPFGLVYVFLWEGLLSSFLEGIRYLSVRGYTLAIMHGLDDVTFTDLDDRVIEFEAGLAGAIAITVVFAWLTVRRLRRMDIP